jgi:hypothetical protein
MANRKSKDTTSEYDEVKDKPKTTETEINKMIEIANNFTLEKVAPNEKRQLISRDEAFAVITELGDIQGIEPHLAFMATCLLFAKGAANQGTPLTLEVIVVDPVTNEKTSVRKEDLIYAYRKTHRNPFVRRMAEAISTEISNFLEKKLVPGDLAKKIDARLMAKGEPPLTPQEKSWASSFCHGNMNLSNISSRLPQLLAEDYNLRFKSGPNNQKANPSGSKGQKGGQRPKGSKTLPLLKEGNK